MNKKEFTDTLKNIKSVIDDIGGVHNALRKLDPDFGGFYLSRVETVLLDMLKKLTDDKYDWIGYYVYELEWGKKWKRGTITLKNKKDVPLKTMSDLYDIIQNKDI